MYCYSNGKIKGHYVIFFIEITRFPLNQCREKEPITKKD